MRRRTRRTVRRNPAKRADLVQRLAEALENGPRGVSLALAVEWTENGEAAWAACNNPEAMIRLLGLVGDGAERAAAVQIVGGVVSKLVPANERPPHEAIAATIALLRKRGTPEAASTAGYLTWEWISEAQEWYGSDALIFAGMAAAQVALGVAEASGLYLTASVGSALAAVAHAAKFAAYEQARRMREEQEERPGGPSLLLDPHATDNAPNWAYKEAWAENARSWAAFVRGKVRGAPALPVR